MTDNEAKPLDPTTIISTITVVLRDPGAELLVIEREVGATYSTSEHGLSYADAEDKTLTMVPSTSILYLTETTVDNIDEIRAQQRAFERSRRRR